jgi:alpha-L-arabinofuranosidase
VAAGNLIHTCAGADVPAGHGDQGSDRADGRADDREQIASGWCTPGRRMPAPDGKLSPMIGGLLWARARRSACVVLAAAFAAVIAAQAPDVGQDVVTLDVGRPGPPISPTMFGVFFEDINFAADGGLYPERVRNRSFEFTEPLYGWRRDFSSRGELVVRTDGALNDNNPHYLRLRSHTADGDFSVANAGFRGMGVESGAEYVLSAYVRAQPGGPRQLVARLADERGQLLAEGSLAGFTSDWKRYETTLRPSATHARARLEIAPSGRGDIDIDMVSLYPKETWKDRPNGLRKDLVQLLADMQPGFIRFPGGCIVEGRRLELRYDWKNTVGGISERQTLVNRWNDEFDHRPTPDYFQSFGLGFFEYFQLAEDVGASPLPIVNCGMACQFNSSETVPLEKLDPFVQDALDLIAFANGPVDSRWGKLRAQMGHPAPFNLKMIGIGNEQWGSQYIDRYTRFAEALRKAHPEIALVASAGPGAAGKEFEYLWTNLRQLKAEIIDEHYYMPPAWFLANSHRYDKYDRSGPKVFAGEYAAQTSGVARPDNRNNWEGAIAEAAFMTGLERNADVVAMTSYAPLLAHVDAWQWTPNLIWFDNLRSYGTPNYYVQKMYATNRGTHMLPIAVNGAAENAQDGLYTSASIDQRNAEVILKAVNATGTARKVRVDLRGTGSIQGNARVIVLASADLKAENSLDQPTRLAPVEKSLAASSSGLDLTLDPHSFTVVRARYSK